MEDVREDLLLEAEFLFLSFAAGIQDAAVWIDFMLFTSNQTGNTLFLAISAAGFANNEKNVRNIATSMGHFIGGGLTVSSGAKVAIGRSLRITDITTAMATSVFVDIVAGPGLIKLRNRRRNRRVLFLIMLKSIVILAFFFNKYIDKNAAKDNSPGKGFVNNRAGI